MGSSTFVVVKDPEWRVDPAALLGSLRAEYSSRQPVVEVAPQHLRGDGWRDAWEVRVTEDADTIVITAPPMTMLELVVRVRAHVPAEVRLEVFDSEVTFDPQELPSGITVDELAGPGWWEDARWLDAGIPQGPPTPEERMTAGKPPHVL